MWLMFAVADVVAFYLPIFTVPNVTCFLQGYEDDFKHDADDDDTNNDSDNDDNNTKLLS
jgi:hypothetical protein